MRTIISLSGLLWGLTFLCCFWQLGNATINRWDEARFGSIALEMLQRGDYINYYFDGVLQTWTSKPPLGIWLIALSYKIFGYNEWALRLPSALATVFAVLILFRLVRLYTDEKVASLVCVVALTCKGIIGHHVARTGDLDAWLLLGLIGFLYQSLRSIDFDARDGLWKAALFFGIAFYAKGTPAFFFVPGIALYLLWRRKLSLIKTWKFFGSVALAGLFPLSWMLINILWAEQKSTAFGANAWERLWLYDTWQRFSGNVEGHGETHNWLFVMKMMDLKFSPWIYVLLLGMLLQVVLKKKRFAISTRPNLVVCSLCCFVTLALLLTVSRSKLAWYVAPLIPLASILTVHVIEPFREHRMYLKIIFWGVLVFAIGKTLHRINSEKVDDFAGKMRMQREVMAEAPAVLVKNDIPQELALYAKWYAKKYIKDNPEIPGTLVLTSAIPQSAVRYRVITGQTDGVTYHLYRMVDP